MTSDMDSAFVVCSFDRNSSWEEYTMRMSCNGCRVLRKGCSDSCQLRPCLQWIRSSESQANATVFLAKFYGRSGLMNLINSGPDYLRPTLFRSLLYEACGRIVNPTYGSVGLLWSGNWHICQAAVENVLKGYPLQPLNLLEIDSPLPPPPPVAAAVAPQSMETVADCKLHNVKSRGRFKRPLYRKPSTEIKQLNLQTLSNEDVEGILGGSQVYNLRWRRCYPKEFQLNSGKPATNFLSTDSSSDSDDLARLKSGFQNVKSNNYNNPIENRAETRAQFEEIEEDQGEDPLQNLLQQNNNNEVENFMSAELTDEKNLALELTLGSPMAETTNARSRQLSSSRMDRSPDLHVSSLRLSLSQ